MRKFKIKLPGLTTNLFRQEKPSVEPKPATEKEKNKKLKRNQKNREQYLKDIQQTSFVGIPEYEMIISNAKTYLCGKVYPPEVAMGINKDFFGINGNMELENGMKVELNSAYSKKGRDFIHPNTGWRYVVCYYGLPLRVDVASSYEELQEINNKLYANGCDFNLMGNVWTINPYEEKISKDWQTIVKDIKAKNNFKIIEELPSIETLLETEKMVVDSKSNIRMGCCTSVKYPHYDSYPKYNYYFDGKWFGATISVRVKMGLTESYSVFTKLPIQFEAKNNTISILQDTDSIYCIKHTHDGDGSSDFLESTGYILAHYEKVAKYTKGGWSFEIYEIPKLIDLDHKLDEHGIMKLFYKAKEIVNRNTFISNQDVEELKSYTKGQWLPINNLEEEKGL